MKNNYSILIIDDNKNFTASVEKILNNFEVIVCNSINSAKNKVGEKIDLVLLDLVFDDKQPDKLQGMNFLPELTRLYPELPVIIMTNHASLDKSVEAIKKGAKDFLHKSKLDWSEWKNRIKNYCADYRKIKILEKSSKIKKEKIDIIGSSSETEYLKMKLKDLAKNSNESSILITGETGTGKNLAVKYFRRFSKRKEKPFKEFSILEKAENILESELFGHEKGAFTGAHKEKKGLFEAANGGILFLDEIGDYSLNVQSKILKFLEDKTITPVGSTETKKLDVQLIMATNKDLREEIGNGNFRKDLFYRIDRIRIDISPLRERKKDIKELTDYYFNYYSKQENTRLVAIKDEVYKILEEYRWPGNVRELQSILLKACADARLFGDTMLEKKHVIPYLYPKQDRNIELTYENYKNKMVMIELEMIDRALKETHGQKTKAAELLDMSADQMRYRVVSNKDLLDKGNYDFIKKYY